MGICSRASSIPITLPSNDIQCAQTLSSLTVLTLTLSMPMCSGPHSQDSARAKLRETPAVKSDVASRDDKADGWSGKHLSGLPDANTWAGVR